MSSEGLPTVRLSDPGIRWEYRVTLVPVTGLFAPNLDVDELGEYLNARGDEGWELVTAELINRGSEMAADLLAILKRPRRD